MAASKLTPRQAAFVTEYLVDLNGTQAAIRAGYTAKGAEVRASELLRIQKVAVAVNAAIAARTAKTEIRAEDVLRELHHLAFIDVGELFDEKTQKLRPLHELPAEVRRAISAVKLNEDGKPGEVKLFDKVRTLELLGKHLALWINDKSAPPPAAPVTVNVNTQVIHEAPPSAERALEVIQFLARVGALPSGTQEADPGGDAEDDEVPRPATHRPAGRVPHRSR